MMKKVNQTPSYGFYSRVLNKPFDTLEELQAAEEKVLKEQEAKTKAAAERKAEANKVEAAFKARNTARHEYNEKIVAAKKAYNEAVLTAKKAFDDAICNATNAKDKAEETYNAALKEFTGKHPEGYHLTLKDGDNVTVLSGQGSNDSDAKINREYNELLDYIFSFWNRK